MRAQFFRLASVAAVIAWVQHVFLIDGSYALSVAHLYEEIIAELTFGVATAVVGLVLTPADTPAFLRLVLGGAVVVVILLSFSTFWNWT